MKKLIKNFDKMTLDDAWRECLRMWWSLSRYPKMKKIDWLEKNYSSRGHKLHASCFFCHYDFFNGGLRGCSRCPAVLVSREWRCSKPEICWFSHRKEFYKSLVKLNKKRLEQNEKAKIEQKI